MDVALVGGFTITSTSLALALMERLSKYFFMLKVIIPELIKAI